MGVEEQHKKNLLTVLHNIPFYMELAFDLNWSKKIYAYCNVFVAKEGYSRFREICVFIYCFTSRSRIFHSSGDVTVTGERLENGDLHVCSALRTFEQGGIFIVTHLLWHKASDFPVSLEGLSH
jgi:hypothetical protein